MRNARSIGWMASSYSKTSVFVHPHVPKNAVYDFYDVVRRCRRYLACPCPLPRIDLKTRIDHPASYSKRDYVQNRTVWGENVLTFMQVKLETSLELILKVRSFWKLKILTYILFHRAFPSQRKFLNGYDLFKLKSPKIPTPRYYNTDMCL